MKKNKVKFEDMEYSKRREILRREYLINPKFHKAIKLLAFKVKQELIDPILKEVNSLEIIINFLIDGFLAFEIIYDKNNKNILGYKELDPNTLESRIISNKENEYKIWIQYSSDIKRQRVLQDKNIIYLSTITPRGYEISFGESLYKGLISYEDNDLILKHTDFIVEKLSKKYNDENECL